MDNILNLTKGKRKYKLFQLGPMDAQIPRGMITAVIGRNGAGKTTFLKGISGIDPFDQGEVSFDGKHINFLDPSVRSNMTYISNDIQMYSDFTVKQAVDFISNLHVKWNSQWFDYWLSTFQIHPEAEIHELSKGMKMKLNLLLGLGHQPKLVLLDEPTDGLDSIARQQFIDMMQKYMEDENRAIVLSTHYTKDVEGICDYVIFMKNGITPLHGEVAELKENYRFFSLPPKTDLANTKGVIHWESTEVETKGVIYSEASINLPVNAVMKTPTLDDIFYFVVERGGRQ